LDHLNSIAKGEKLALQPVEGVRGLQYDLSRQSHDLDLLDVRFGSAGVDSVGQSFNLFNSRLTGFRQGMSGAERFDDSPLAETHLLELLREESDRLEGKDSLILEPSADLPDSTVWFFAVREQLFRSGNSCWAGSKRMLALQNDSKVRERPRKHTLVSVTQVRKQVGEC
jgi:hypothetical protein